MWLWASYFMSLCLNFLLNQMCPDILHFNGWQKIKLKRNESLTVTFVVASEETAWWTGWQAEKGWGGRAEKDMRGGQRISMKSFTQRLPTRPTRNASPYCVWGNILPFRSLPFQMETHVCPGPVLPIMEKAPKHPLIGRPQKPHPSDNDDNSVGNASRCSCYSASCIFRASWGLAVC